MANTKADPTFGLVTNPAKPRPANDQVGVNITIPYNLHRQLKIKCIQLDLTLTEAITAAVQDWVGA